VIIDTRGAGMASVDRGGILRFKPIFWAATLDRTSTSRAVTDVRALGDEVASLRDATTASDKYLRVAQVQFRSGLAASLTVIDAERTVLANQIGLAQARTGEMAASLRLVKALGGGWQPLTPFLPALKPAIEQKHCSCNCSLDASYFGRPGANAAFDEETSHV
jgi:hypothetical protein